MSKRKANADPPTVPPPVQPSPGTTITAERAMKWTSADTLSVIENIGLVQMNNKPENAKQLRSNDYTRAFNKFLVDNPQLKHCTKKQFMDHWTNLKRAFSELKNISGMGWDEDKQIVIATNEFWWEDLKLKD